MLKIRSCAEVNKIKACAANIHLNKKSTIYLASAAVISYNTPYI